MITMLPLTVTLRDYGHAEKISGALSRRLSETGAPESAVGKTGEIAYVGKYCILSRSGARCPWHY